MQKYLLLTLLFLPSCAKTILPVPVPDYKREYILKPPGNGKVLEPAEIEAYPVARYVDPSNKNIMHEKHYVYRRQAPKWKLNSNPSEMVYLGTVANRPAGKPISPSQTEISHAVYAQRQTEKQMDEQARSIDALLKNQQELANSQAEITNLILKSKQAPATKKP